jgi:hypothetical protein
MLWSRRCALSSGPQKKSSSPMIPIESCYLYIPWAALNRPSRSFTKNLSLSLSHSEIRLLRKKNPSYYYETCLIYPQRIFGQQLDSELRFIIIHSSDTFLLNFFFPFIPSLSLHFLLPCASLTLLFFFL